MGKLGATGMAAALCVGLAWANARGDDGDGGDLRSLPPTKPSVWSGMFGSKEAVAAPKKLTPVEQPPPVRPTISNPATIQAREEAAYFRRLAVCDELMDIAENKGDEVLRERVFQLMDKAWAVLQQRTGGSAVRTMDEAALARSPHAAPDPTVRSAASVGTLDVTPASQRRE